VKLLPRKPVDTADNLGRGMDFALVTLVFLGLGYLLDRWLGTEPLFMIGLVVFAMVGQFVRMWYGYDAAMRQLEEERRNGAAAPRREHIPDRSTSQSA
jgi:F0F1-type ATP synthase assembly protein I